MDPYGLIQIEMAAKTKFVDSLRKLKANGRVYIKLKTIKKLENSDYDIEMEEDDSIFIPTKSSVINVSGAVMAQGSYVYSARSFKDYVKMAGGYADYADKAKKKTLERVSKKCAAVLYGYVYSRKDETIEAVIAAGLKKKKLMLACAESCTGGLISKRITDGAGASRYFLGSVVAYSNKIKERMLAVPSELLKKHGAVSRQAARQMAKGICEKTGADIGISVTGIAGPGGGTKGKPVGLVFLGISFNGKTAVKKLNWKGDRERIRWLTSQIAFFEIWKLIK